jgi:Flp pilus assembly protein TadG
MKRPIFSPSAFFRRFARDRRGATAIIVALMSTTIIGFTGFAVDMGHIFYIQRKMQASSDAAALAGAIKINCCTTSEAVSTANSFSAVTGGANQITEVSVTMVSGYPKLECLATLTNQGITCNGPDSANAIQVKEQANVPTWFAQIFGVTTIPVSVVSTAAYQGGGTGGGGGGSALGQDVLIIIDSTASMNDSDSSCSVSSGTREICSKAFVAAMLKGMNPQSQQVALWTFPGFKNATDAQPDYTCGEQITSSDLTSYANSPVYQVVGFDTGYKSTPSATTLNNSDNLVKAVAADTACTSGVTAVGGYGTYYAGILTAAQSFLAGDGNPTHQKVIVIVSDGGSNASSSNVPSGNATDQCQEAITAAKAATTAGTIVISVAYGAETATGSSSTCTTDTTGTLAGLSSCTTMTDMASAPKYFYADGSGGSGTCNSQNATSGSGETSSDLIAIAPLIVQQLQKPRLIPDNTT